MELDPASHWLDPRRKKVHGSTFDLDSRPAAAVRRRSATLSRGQGEVRGVRLRRCAAKRSPSSVTMAETPGSLSCCFCK